MTDKRQQVIDAIRQRKGMGPVRAIAELAGLTEKVCSFHISSLKRDGMLIVEKTDSRARTRKYVLTEDIKPAFNIHGPWGNYGTNRKQ